MYTIPLTRVLVRLAAKIAWIEQVRYTVYVAVDDVEAIFADPGDITQFANRHHRIAIWELQEHTIDVRWRLCVLLKRLWERRKHI